MISNARGKHSSPGVYIEEVDKTYATKSLGITTLGVIGETLKGPAFEPINISDWAEFQDYFGGTSTEKFKGSDYPKYELPYIAKSYLEESKQLQVCRVLGFSGYNAGPAWALYANDSNANKTVIGIIRSKAKYANASNSGDICNPNAEYDVLTFDVTTLGIAGYTSVEGVLNGCASSTSTSTGSFTVSSGNYGKFTLNINQNTKVSVSLNPGDKDYIIDVLGMSADSGDYPIFVEELYDLAYIAGVDAGTFTSISLQKLSTADITVSPKTIEGFINDGNYTRLANSTDNANKLYLVDAAIELPNGTKYAVGDILKKGSGSFTKDSSLGNQVASIKGVYYALVGSEIKLYNDSSLDNYRSPYRFASTPWFVSELKGNGTELDIKKLFRFHTISDGNAANSQIKISIANILPDEGFFDVIIRDYNDIDNAPVVLERYNKCSMVPGSSNYIGFKIGTFNGDYALKSKYVTVEVIESDVTENCVPCGFLGYPLRKYDALKNVGLAYNTKYRETLKPNRQYYGMSDIVGVDLDVLTFKGNDAYVETQLPSDGYSNGFHLDSILNNAAVNYTVDGVAGYKFNTVDENQGYTPGSTVSGIPRIGSEELMENTIYADKRMRKFTCYPYGGFDGWDIYRDQRTNTDEFQASKYKGVVGAGKTFSTEFDAASHGLSGRVINSDYYAYLAGYKQFENPHKIDINLIATPGIDYVNNLALVNEVLDIVEDARQGDCLYIVTTPDKASGMPDSPDAMYTADEAVSNFENSELNTSYAATYFPWVKYYDAANKKYINLPVTKDVMRNFAHTDNVAHPWFASAGMSRGNVDCVKARHFTKLEEEDVLYEGMINPVKSFGTDGVKIWGNKTMYLEDTPLNRINVRRLMIRIKGLVTKASRQLIFEQNDNTVDAQFRSIVEPILANAKQNRGLSDYKIKTDTSAEARDRHELPAAIYVKPINCLEYIPITFTIYPEGAKFDE